jgi:DNA-binding SARP family transcriptional activator
LKKFLKERPRHADNLLTLSETYEKMSNHRSAIITLKKLLEFEPYNEQAKEKLKILETPEIKETL